MRNRKRILRWALWSALVLLAVLVGSYAYLTNPDRLRATALAALERMGVTGVDIAHVTYSPAEGVRLRDIVLSRPPRELSSDNISLPPLLRIESMTIGCSTLSLLAGHLRPTSIDFDGVALAVLCDTVPGEDEWTLMPSHIDSDEWDRALRFLDHDLPPLHIDQADLQLLAIEHGDARVLERLPLRVRGEAALRGYTLTAEALSGAGAPLATLDWLPADRSIDLTVNWAGIDTLEHILPPRVLEVLTKLHATGQVRLQRLRYRLADVDAVGAKPGLAAAEIDLRNVSCVLPLETSEEDESGAVPEGAAVHFLRVHDASLVVTYQCDTPATPGRLRMSLQGGLNDASVSGALVTQARALAELWAAPADEPDASGTSAAPVSLDDVVNAELVVRGLELPTESSAPRLLASPRMPRPVRTALEHYHPQGRIDLRVQVHPAVSGLSAERPLDRLEVVAIPRGIRCQYYEFPYAVDVVHGRVRFAHGQFFFEEIGGRHGAGTIGASGVIFSTDSFSGFDLTIRGQNVALQQDLYHALPESYRRLWENAAPIGGVDVVAHIGRPHGTPETGPLPLRTRLEAELLGGSLGLADGRRIDHVDGKATLENGVLELHDLHGYDGATAVRLNARINAHDGGEGSDIRFTLAGHEAEYHTDVQPVADGPKQSIRFTGRADVWGRVADPMGAKREARLAIRIDEGQLTGFDPERHWTVEGGWARIDGKHRELRSFHARQGDATLEAHGRLPAGDGTDALSLELDASAPAMDVLLPQFVPAAWMNVADRAGLSGPGRVHVSLTGSATPGAEPTAQVDVAADRMQAKSLPLPLRNVQAQISVEPGSFELRSSRARLGSGTLEADAHGHWGEQPTQVTLSASLDNLTFTDELVKSLPAPLRDLLTRMAPVGKVDAYFSRVHFTGGESPTWQIDGRIPLEAESIRLGLGMTDVAGVLTGTCTIDGQGRTRVEAGVDVEQATLSGRPLRNLHGTLVREPNDPWVRLVDMHADFCDGQAVGAVSFDPHTARYELSLSVRDLLLSELAPRKEGPADGDAKKPPRRGRLDGEINLAGSADSPASRRGSGNIRIHGASILQTPVLASVAEAESAEGKRLPETADTVDVRFLWEGDTLRLLRVDIQSKNLRMIGEGSWNLRDDTIHLTLLGAHPEHLARVPLLTDLVESAGRELMQYQVDGKLSKPHVTIRPLYKLDETFRALLGSE